jgi:hypothetical protein
MAMPELRRQDLFRIEELNSPAFGACELGQVGHRLDWQIGFLE